jgi:hypothetical protein
MAQTLHDILAQCCAAAKADEEESRWGEYLDWLTQRLVNMDQVLRPIMKSLP